MDQLTEKLRGKLEQKKNEQSYRQLKNFDQLIDFSSNDYLGLSKEITPIEGSNGSTGSRLISGNHKRLEDLELFLADFHRMEAALFFNSGYTANLGLFSTIPQRGDVVLYDELIHVSVREGLRLSLAKSFSFQHNDLFDLGKKLEKHKDGGSVFVAVESVYSMDGDSPNMKSLVELCKSHGANLIVDEAHAIGLVGKKGEGIVANLGLQQDVFAVSVTFGKALGCHGAAILGSETLKSYLINFCRPFIYTTGPSEHTANVVLKHYELMQEKRNQNVRTKEFKTILQEVLGDKVINGEFGNILTIPVSGNERVKMVDEELQKRGFFVKAIWSPTVPEGQERLRLCLHTYNTEMEVRALANALKELLQA